MPDYWVDETTPKISRDNFQSYCLLYGAIRDADIRHYYGAALVPLISLIDAISYRDDTHGVYTGTWSGLQYPFLVYGLEAASAFATGTLSSQLLGPRLYYPWRGKPYGGGFNIRWPRISGLCPLQGAIAKGPPHATIRSLLNDCFVSGRHRSLVSDLTRPSPNVISAVAGE